MKEIWIQFEGTSMCPMEGHYLMCIRQENFFVDGVDGVAVFNSDLKKDLLH